MSVRRAQDEKGVIYYCSLTCYKWINLFHLTDFYDHIYNWFNILDEKGIKTTGYVIMPNHLHCMLYLPPSSQSINKIIGNAKRFMAYEIVARLKAGQNWELLKVLEDGVQPGDRKKGKLHEVLEPSFDAKQCFNEAFIKQKLSYIHHNPVNGKWQLVRDFTEYPHSSAAFYELGKPALIKLTHYLDVWRDEA